MRPDAAFLIAIGLAFCGLVAIVSGLIGQASVRRPRCRRCRADARAQAWAAEPRCPCGADLTRRGAVRFKGRDRSPSAVIAGTLLCAIAALLTWWHLDRRERRLTWRELLPSSWEASNLRSGEEPNAALHSLLRRVAADQIDARDRVLAIDAILETPGGRGDLRSRALAKLASDPSMMAEPARSGAERALAGAATLLRRVPEADAGGSAASEAGGDSNQRILTATLIGRIDPSTGLLSLTPIEIDLGAPSGWSRYIIVHAVLVDGVPIAETEGIAYRDASGVHRWLRRTPNRSDEGYDRIVAMAARASPTVRLEVEDLLLPIHIGSAPAILSLIEESMQGGGEGSDPAAAGGPAPTLPAALLHRSRRGVITATVGERPAPESTPTGPAGGRP